MIRRAILPPMCLRFVRFVLVVCTTKQGFRDFYLSLSLLQAPRDREPVALSPPSGREDYCREFESRWPRASRRCARVCVCQCCCSTVSENCRRV